MPQTINILTQSPTFDLTEWEITDYKTGLENYDNRIIFCETKQVFKFNKCKGMIMPRSRVLRSNKEESKLVENVISATIDAGFCGRLVFKIILTLEGLVRLGNMPGFEAVPFQKLIQNSVQIDLNPFPKNYYQGTNQTDLEPDVIFTSSKPKRDFIPWWERVSEEDCLEWARYYEMNNPNSPAVIANKAARLTDKEFDKAVEELDESNQSNLSMEETIDFANQVVKEVRKTSQEERLNGAPDDLGNIQDNNFGSTTSRIIQGGRAGGKSTLAKHYLDKFQEEKETSEVQQMESSILDESNP